MKKEVFLERALQVHGDKYDYSMVPDEFKTKDKLPVICKKHGLFYITIGNLISNRRGCAACGFEHVSGLKRKRAAESFVEKAKQVHGDLYDYSLTSYEKSDVKVKIICKTHGIFEQEPTSHLSGRGCFKCGRELSGLKQKDTAESYIAKAREVHGTLYDYSKMVYIDQKHKIEIVCKIHGSFWQKTNNHLNGNGCPLCLPDKLSSINRLDSEVVEKQVIEACEKSGKLLINFEYKNSDSFCTLSCPIHGEYQQRIRAIISGVGCFKCGVEASAKARSNPVSSYIIRFKQMYGNRYDYSLAEGATAKTKFKVICPDHGIFNTTVDNHLKGKACPKCSTSLTGYKVQKQGTFYIVQVTESVIKFGISNNFKNRLSALQKGSCFKLQPLYCFTFEDGSIARNIEAEVLASDITRSVVNRCDFKSGYTETTYLSNLSTILSIVEKYKPD